MPRTYISLTLEDAKHMLSATEAKAASFGIPYCVAVVDAGGHLVAFLRQDGALIGSINLAINKAATARIFDKTTSDLATLAQSGRLLFGIQESNAGKVIIFGGGVPVVWEGTIIGAAGASVGTVEQDMAVAEAALAAPWLSGTVAREHELFPHHVERKGEMKAARMHEYGKAPILEDIPIPEIQPDEILVNVRACGMCRSDVQLIDGYFRRYADIPTPITLGHEITGMVSKMGSIVPKASGFQEGDHVVVAPGWGDGTCRYCQMGNTHICPNVRWPGFGPVGGFAEFIPVPARYLINVDRRLAFEKLAPLTDAGLTPYRGIKKLRDAGALGPDRVLGIFGAGGLGEYAVQYAKLLGSGAKVVVFDRNADKLNIARQNGADHVINDKGKSSIDIAKELDQAVGQNDLDAIMDCAGAPEMMQVAFSLLSISGHYVDVGLVGDRIDIPLFPRVSREQTFHGSFWGNYTDLSEVMALATENKIRHNIKLFTFEEINENLDLLRTGDIIGRAVMKF